MVPLLTRPKFEGGDAEKPAEDGGDKGGEGEGEGDDDDGDGKAEEKKEPEEELSAGEKVGNMPAGDYTIHILVQSARQLIADGDDTCDPVIEFSVDKISGKTSKKKDVTRSGTVKFNEHIFLEVNGLTATEALNAQLKMKVVHQGFFCSDLIGQFEMPISKIYNMKEHCLLN
jgi:hypothetical protein